MPILPTGLRIFGCVGFFMQIEIDASELDEDRVEALTDAVLLCLSTMPFEYAEDEVAVALCSVLALIVGGDGETIH